MEDRPKSKELTPERVVQILRSHGTEVSPEEATTILAFIRKLAHITVIQILSKRI